MTNLLIQLFPIIIWSHLILFDNIDYGSVSIIILNFRDHNHKVKDLQRK